MRRKGRGKGYAYLTFSPTGRNHGDIVLYPESQWKQFQGFLVRANRYPGLQMVGGEGGQSHNSEQRKKKVVLVEVCVCVHMWLRTTSKVLLHISRSFRTHSSGSQPGSMTSCGRLCEGRKNVLSHALPPTQLPHTHTALPSGLHCVRESQQGLQSLHNFQQGSSSEDGHPHHQVRV